MIQGKIKGVGQIGSQIAMTKISLIFGTRPEAIKLCPLVLALQDHSDFQPHVCVTGQHREMLDQVLDVFGVTPDVDLNLMQPNQTLAGLTARAITSIDKYLADYKPELVIVQGDTTTVLCASLAAFYRQIPVGHVEAGLRTWNKQSPFPEEINRVLRCLKRPSLFYALDSTRSLVDRAILNHEIECMSLLVHSFVVGMPQKRFRGSVRVRF